MQAVADPHTTHHSPLLSYDTDGRCLLVCHYVRARCMLLLPLQVESCSVKSSSPYSSQIISRFRFSCHKFNKIRVIFVSLYKFIKKLDSKIFPTIPIMYHKIYGSAGDEQGGTMQRNENMDMEKKIHIDQ